MFVILEGFVEKKGKKKTDFTFEFDKPFDKKREIKLRDRWEFQKEKGLFKRSERVPGPWLDASFEGETIGLIGQSNRWLTRGIFNGQISLNLM